MEGKNIVNKILFSENDLELIKENHSIQNIITKNFESNLIYLKIMVLVILVIACCINRYTNFIKKKPVTFGCETVFYGIMGTIPFLYMEKYREKHDPNYFNIFMIMFFLYCLFNILFEISGFYSYMYEEEEVDDIINCDKKVSKNETILKNFHLSFSITFIIVMIYMIFILFLITFEVFDYDISGYKNNKFTLFGLETLLFAFCNSIPFLLIAYNRTNTQFKFDKNLLEILLLFIKFIIFHLILQGSGFYKSVLNY